MEHKVIIAGTNNGIWAINPKNKMMLRVKTGKDKYNGKKIIVGPELLDIYASNRGIHHARKAYNKEYNFTERYVSYQKSIIIFDSISGNSICTLSPRGKTVLEWPKKEGSNYYINDKLNDKLKKLEYEGLVFMFKKEGDKLMGRLNGIEKIILHSPKEENIPNNLSHEGKKIYFNDKKIMALNGEIKYLKELDMDKFSHIFRIKNKARYHKNKEFFK